MCATLPPEVCLETKAPVTRKITVKIPRKIDYLSNFGQPEIAKSPANPASASAKSNVWGSLELPLSNQQVKQIRGGGEGYLFK
jgi:hypothetical protein